jgi:3-hydroxyisobutyrate dehydrogenase
MCSTVDPDWSTKIEDRLADHGLLYLEAPVSGGDVLAAKGELTFITAGKPEAHKLAGEALKAMSANVYHVGDRAGAACSVKIINQLLVATHMAAAAEAVALGIRQGIDPGMLYDVITHSVGNSRMFEMRVPQIVKGDYSASAALDILVKDLGLVLDAARASNFPLPLASTVHQMFLQATAAGHGGEASAAVIKIFPGIRLPRT